MRRMITIVLALMLMTGCTLISKVQEMTPKQKATWAMNTFVMEMQKLQMQARCYFHDHTTDEQRLIMRYKMALLQEAYKLIKEYAEAAEAGRDPDMNLEGRIFDILNAVISAAETGVPEGAKLYPPPKQSPGVIITPDGVSPKTNQI